jgi:signal peptidase I
MKTEKIKTSRKALRLLIKNWAVPIGCGLLFLFLLKCVLFVGYVPSASMEPTIKQNSLILGLRVFGDPARGDVVAFRHEGRLLVKRIAACPGDTVTVRGVALTVPDGCYFMLGDNRDASIDSRYWDDPFVTRTRIVAKIWAANSIGWCSPRNRLILLLGSHH